MNPALELPLSVFGAILARRSVRAYVDQILPRATVRTLLEAAIRAPTAMHLEPWSFIVVQDKTTLRQLSARTQQLIAEEPGLAAPRQAAGEAPNDANADVFHDATTLIVICADLSTPYAIADVWLAAENLMLAASAMGLGSCVIGSAIMTLNLAEEKARLGIPTGISAVAPIIVGLTRKSPPATTRKPPIIHTWIEPPQALQGLAPSRQAATKKLAA